MSPGRPPFYTSVEDLQQKIDGYFEYIKGETQEVVKGSKYNECKGAHVDIKETIFVRPPERPTITGLALFLGFTSRQAIMNYEEKPEFVDAIKTAKLRIEAAYEQAIFNGNAAGPIFALKNFGWTDKQEIDQNSKHSGEISIRWVEPELRHSEDKGGDGELPSLSEGV